MVGADRGLPERNLNLAGYSWADHGLPLRREMINSMLYSRTGHGLSLKFYPFSGIGL